jgi:phage tail protein X
LPTAKIVLAHLKEMLDYYVRLRLVELEGDMFKALVQREAGALSATYEKVLSAREGLTGWESKRLRAL